MLRPATPLTVLLLISFLLLLLSVLSTPITKGIPIAKFKGVSFGVFGYCTPQKCSGVRIGYNTDGLFGAGNNGDFSLPSAARHSLSSLLVVHPIAALLNLTCLALAAAAHLHSPSHSARYLLALLILLLPTLLVTLLAFLVDILLFVPHLEWGGWIVLASTILITASGVVTCAMRRTLVSRKARKKRIAENAEMSGENFYNRQRELQKTDTASPRTSVEPKMPMVNGAPGSNTLPAFALYDKEQAISEERSDLSQRTPSNATNRGAMGYGGSNGEALGPVRSRSQDQYMGARDEYGSPVPSSNALGAAPPNLQRDPADPTLRQRSSRERINGVPPGPRGGFGYGGPRGRGGYPPRGGYGPPRGGFGGPRGGPNQAFGRGGYNDGRGDYNNGRGRGGAMAAGVGAGMAAGALMGRSQQGPPPGYPPQGQRVSPEGYSSQDDLRRTPLQGYAGAPGGPRQPSPGRQMRRPSPAITPPLPQDGPFVGQAVEMNAATGRISQAAGRPEEGESVHGAVTLQPGQPHYSPDQPSPSSQYSSPGVLRPPNMAQQPDLASPSSMYSHAPDNYVPQRAAWATNSRTNSPMRGRGGPSPPEISSGLSSNVGSGSATSQLRPRRPSSHYYEDVDPRFSDVNIDPSPPLPDHQHQQPTLPASLIPSAGAGAVASSARYLQPTQGIPPTASDETLQDGARSPNGSEASHFTSVSQRGVNPRWRPGSEDLRSMPPASSMRKPVQGMPGAPSRERDTNVLLQHNPDFEIPGMRPPGRGPGGGGGPRGGGGGLGGAMGGQPGTGRMQQMQMQPGGNTNTNTNPPVNGLTGVGRYPHP